MTAEQAAKVPGAIVACEWHMRPAGEKALGVQLDKLATWARSFNIPHDPQAMPAAYASLVSLPPDLLVKAFDRVMSEAVDTFRLPLPAVIRKQVAEELDSRHTVRRGLHLIARAPVDRRGQRTQAELDAVNAAMAKVRASLAANTSEIQKGAA